LKLFTLNDNPKLIFRILKEPNDCDLDECKEALMEAKVSESEKRWLLGIDGLLTRGLFIILLAVLCVVETIYIEGHARGVFGSMDTVSLKGYMLRCQEITFFFDLATAVAEESIKANSLTTTLTKAWIE
jgi:hypothetical protein